MAPATPHHRSGTRTRSFAPPAAGGQPHQLFAAFDPALVSWALFLGPPTEPAPDSALPYPLRHCRSVPRGACSLARSPGMLPPPCAGSSSHPGACSLLRSLRVLPAPGPGSRSLPGATCNTPLALPRALKLSENGALRRMERAPLGRHGLAVMGRSGSVLHTEPSLPAGKSPESPFRRPFRLSHGQILPLLCPIPSDFLNPTPQCTIIRPASSPPGTNENETAPPSNHLRALFTGSPRLFALPVPPPQPDQGSIRLGFCPQGGRGLKPPVRTPPPCHF